MEDIVFMRLLFVGGLLGMAASALVVSYVIDALSQWLGPRRTHVGHRTAVAGRSAR
jgi:hypothetical protein